MWFGKLTILVDPIPSGVDPMLTTSHAVLSGRHRQESTM